jgi:hypothetical protein
LHEKLALRRYVSTELRYGGKSGAALRPPSLLLSSPFAAAAVCAAGDVSAMITSPSAESDLLIALASLSRWPIATSQGQSISS